MFLLLLVARSKLVPDFALTIHLLHLLVTSLYSRALPAHWFWWALQIASAALMTSLGVWSCQYRELQPIKFGGAARAAGRSGATEAALEEGGVGFVRGRGRDAGRDGSGAYEMVGMGEGDGDAIGKG